MSRRLSLAIHGLAGWAICGATVGIGRQLVSMQTTLLIHAVVAPVVFALLSWHHAYWFPRSAAGRTALAMMALVVGLDALVVAPFLERSYAMFRSVIGTWLPFASIGAASYLATRASASRRRGTAVEAAELLAAPDRRR